MSFEGEKNREEKLKEIEEHKTWLIENENEDKQRDFLIFVCSECGLRITFEKNKNRNTTGMTFIYQDYKEYFINNSDFELFPNKYKIRKISTWGAPTSYICLDCGHGVFNEEVPTKECEQCGSKIFTKGNELEGKLCPICSTAFSKGLEILGYEKYCEKRNEINNEWWNIYRERYKVKKPEPVIFTEEENLEEKRQNAIMKIHNEKDFVINNKNNIIFFRLDDAFWEGSFNCLLEWNNKNNGNFLLYDGCEIWIDKNIEYEKIENVLKILARYDYFNKKLYKEKIGLDGYTVTLEVKYEKNYKELAMWCPTDGILKEIGNLLVEYAGMNIKELYEYAWE